MHFHELTAKDMIRLMTKPVFGVSDQVQSDTNLAIQPQKMVRGLKFRIYKEERLYIYVTKTKVLISFVVTAQLICAFVFAFANKTGFLMILIYSRYKAHM